MHRKIQNQKVNQHSPIPSSRPDTIREIGGGPSPVPEDKEIELPPAGPADRLPEPYVSRSDPNEYRIIQLQNGIKCMLISAFGCEKVKAVEPTAKPPSKCENRLKETSVFNRRRLMRTERGINAKREETELAKREEERTAARNRGKYQGPNCEHTPKESEPRSGSILEQLFPPPDDNEDSENLSNENIWHIPEERIVSPELAVFAARRKCARGSKAKISIRVPYGSMNAVKGFEGLATVVANYVNNKFRKDLKSKGGISPTYLTSFVECESIVLDIAFSGSPDLEEILKRIGKTLTDISFTEEIDKRALIEAVENTQFGEDGAYFSKLFLKTTRARFLSFLAKERHPMQIFGGENSVVNANSSPSARPDSSEESGSDSEGQEPSQEASSLEYQVSQFLSQYYNGLDMTLVVEAEQPLDNLEEWTTQSFSAVQEGDEGRTATGEPDPFDTLEFRKFYVFKHEQIRYGQAQYLTISWSLPPGLWQNTFVKPLDYLSSIISEKGSHGLEYYLGERDLAVQVTCGCPEDGYHRNQFHSLFEIQIMLLNQELEKVDEVISATFGYISFLRQNGPNKVYYQDLAKLRRSKFNDIGHEETEYSVNEMWPYSSNLYAFGGLPDWLHLYNPRECIVAPFLIVDFDQGAIPAIAEATGLLVPETANFMLLLYPSAELPEDQFGEELTHPVLNVNYYVRDISDSQYSLWRNPDVPMQFEFPSKNQFLTTSRCLKLEEEFENRQESEDIILFDNGRNSKYRIWYLPTIKRDDVSYYLHFVSPEAYESADHAVMLRLWTCILQDALIGLGAELHNAGIYGHVETTRYGIYLHLSSWNNKFALASSIILKAITGPKEDIVSSEKFERIKSQLLKRFAVGLNYDDVVADDIYRRLTEKGKWTRAEQCIEASIVTLDEFKDFVLEFRRQCSFAAFLTGNVAEKDAQELANVFDNYIPAKHMVALKTCRTKIYEIPSGEKIVRMKSPQGSGTDMTTIYYQIGRSDVKSRLIADFIFTAMRSDFPYEGPNQAAMILTEKEAKSKKKSAKQIEFEKKNEYTALAVEVFDNQGILTVKIRDNKFSEDDADVHRRSTRIQNTLNYFYKTKLESMCIGEFQKKRRCVEQSCQQMRGLGYYYKENTMDKYLKRSAALRDLTFRFDEQCLRREAIKTLTLHDVQTWFKTHLLPESKECRRIAIHMLGCCETDPLTPYQTAFDDSKQTREHRQKWMQCQAEHWYPKEVDLGKIKMYEFLAEEGGDQDNCDGPFITDVDGFTSKLRKFPVLPLQD